MKPVKALRDLLAAVDADLKADPTRALGPLADAAAEARGSLERYDARALNEQRREQTIARALESIASECKGRERLTANERRDALDRIAELARSGLRRDDHAPE